MQQYAHVSIFSSCAVCQSSCTYAVCSAHLPIGGLRREGWLALR
jgi:hypothetical protein